MFFPSLIMQCCPLPFSTTTMFRSTSSSTSPSPLGPSSSSPSALGDSASSDDDGPHCGTADSVLPLPAAASRRGAATPILSAKTARRWKNYYSGRSSFSLLRAGLLIVTVSLYYVCSSLFVDSQAESFDGAAGSRAIIHSRRLLQTDPENQT